MWKTLPSKEIQDCSIQNLRADPINFDSLNIKWTLRCDLRHKDFDFTKLYVEHEEFLACEDKTIKNWRRNITHATTRQEYETSVGVEVRSLH